MEIPTNINWLKDSRHRIQIKPNPSTLCPMCLKEYDSEPKIPKFLTCGHTICAECIKTKSKGKKIQCPQCNKITSKHSNELATNNSFLTLSKGEKYLYFCSDHKHEINFYCTDDQKFLCKTCINEHKNHVYFGLCDAITLNLVEEKQKVIDIQESAIESSINEYKKSLNDINSIIEQINLLVDSHIHALKETEAKMIKEIREGTLACIKQVQDLDEILEVGNLKVELASKFVSLSESLTEIAKIKQHFNSASIVEKLSYDTKSQTNSKPISIVTAYRFLDQLKAKVNYREIIAGKSFKLPAHGVYDIELAISNIIEENKENQPRRSSVVNWDDVLTSLNNHTKPSEDTLPPFEFYSNHGMPKELSLSEILESGDIYTGQYNNEGQKHGRGIYTWTNGDQYIGYWKNDRRTGYGRLIKKNGDIYEGNFLEDKFNGSGVYTFGNKSKYFGFWSDNKMNGQGMFTWPDGASYNGAWIDGKQHGKGTLIDKDGNRIEGEWVHGEKIA